ncbi:DUF2878 family protein [Thalassotalea sp. G20_0]|uniref:DUF2878 family protein n=1 Tax=Thalassotalea sp. G20_0 TaxID=2821093 RepID=UPI001ADD1B8C|nr:DUF2878 family protein [Thalassotalea sp. G20_0]MBO9492705.1 DUF2878 family protein [Thalassotalea sp. G20_0]
MMTNDKIKLIANYLLFQLGWLACVLWGDQIALAAAVIVLFIHLLWIGNWHKEKQIQVRLL